MFIFFINAYENENNSKVFFVNKYNYDIANNSNASDVFVI